jgi:hypothetical protein
MPQSGKLLAWIKPRDEQEFVGAFVGGGSPARPPATRTFSTPDEARDWIETEAGELGVPVEWLAER